MRPLLHPLRLLKALRARHLEYGRRHIAAFVLLGAALACAALAGVAWAAGFDRIADFLSRPAWTWFPIALGGEVVAYLGYTLAFHEITRVEAKTRVRFLETVALVAAGFGMFIARGGFAVDHEILERRCDDKSEAKLRVLGLGMLEYVILAPATCAAACVLLVRHSHISTGFTMPWAVGVPAGFLLAFALMSRRGWFSGANGWRGTIGTALDALGLLDRMARRGGAGVRAVLGMALYWAGDAFCLWACLHVFFGHELSVAAFVVGYATGYALSRRTLPLAGAGVVEALLPFALLWVSLPLAAGMLAVLMYRVLNLWLPLLPAMVGFRHLRTTHA
jgi:uncharacterized membrane protein YbhN (UPF0104 family)